MADDELNCRKLRWDLKLAGRSWQMSTGRDRIGKEGLADFTSITLDLHVFHFRPFDADWNWLYIAAAGMATRPFQIGIW